MLRRDLGREGRCPNYIRSDTLCWPLVNYAAGQPGDARGKYSTTRTCMAIGVSRSSGRARPFLYYLYVDHVRSSLDRTRFGSIGTPDIVHALA